MQIDRNESDERITVYVLGFSLINPLAGSQRAKDGSLLDGFGGGIKWRSGPLCSVP